MLRHYTEHLGEVKKIHIVLWKLPVIQANYQVLCYRWPAAIIIALRHEFLKKNLYLVREARLQKIISFAVINSYGLLWSNFT